MPSQLSDLLPEVLTQVPRCSDILAEQMILRSCVDFFTRSKLYWVDLATISVVADQAEYPLTNPTGYQILHLRSGTIDTIPLITTSEEALDLEWQTLQQKFSWSYYQDGSEAPGAIEDWRFAVSSLPGLVYCPMPNTAVLVGKPTAAIADALKLRVVCIPVAKSTEIEDWIYARYRYTLIDGSVGLLKMMSDKPFTDRNGAKDFMGSFEDGVGKAEGAALRSYQRNDQPVMRSKTWR